MQFERQLASPIFLIDTILLLLLSLLYSDYVVLIILEALSKIFPLNLNRPWKFRIVGEKRGMPPGYMSDV